MSDRRRPVTEAGGTEDAPQAVEATAEHAAAREIPLDQFSILPTFPEPTTGVVTVTGIGTSVLSLHRAAVMRFSGMTKRTLSALLELWNHS